jgi:hypothetical protein
MNVDPTTIIPTVPTLLLVLVNFFVPYAVALVTAPFWPKTAKKFVSIGVSLILTAAVLTIAHFGFAYAIPTWPQLLLLGILVSQTVYTTLLKPTADVVAATSGVGSKQVVVATSTSVTNSVIAPTASDGGGGAHSA